MTALRVPVPHGELHVLDVGPRDDATPIVFLHGFGFDGDAWRDELAALGAERRCIAYDLRGFGRSTLPTAPFAHYQDLGALVDALGLARVDVVGLSLGGLVAIDVALHHAARVRRVVVMGSVLAGWPYKTDEASPHAVWATGKRDGVAAARRLWLDARLFAPTMANARARPRFEAMVEAFHGWQWANDVPLVRPQPPAAERLGELAPPVLALIGELDVADLHDIADAIATRAPRGTKQILPGVGHVANLEAPELVHAALRAFLAPDAG